MNPHPNNLHSVSQPPTSCSPSHPHHSYNITSNKNPTYPRSPRSEEGKVEETQTTRNSPSRSREYPNLFISQFCQLIRTTFTSSTPKDFLSLFSSFSIFFQTTTRPSFHLLLPQLPSVKVVGNNKSLIVVPKVLHFRTIHLLYSIFLPISNFRNTFFIFYSIKKHALYIFKPKY